MMMMRTNKSILRKTPCQVCQSFQAEMVYHLPEGNYVKCVICGLVSVDPLPDFGKMLKQADYWSQVHHISPLKVNQHYSRSFQEIAFKKYLDMALPYRRNGNLLDFGCGIGGFVDAAEREGWNAYGIDISPSVEVAKAHGLNAYHCPIDELPISDHYFDVITLFDVIEHIVDLQKTVLDIRRLLRPNGALICITPNLNSLSSKLLGSKWNAIQPDDHVTLFTKDTLTYFLQTTGFSSVSSSTLDFNFLYMRYLFTEKPNIEDHDALQKRNRNLTSDIIKFPILRIARQLINGVLDWTGMGDRLIIEARYDKRFF